MWKWVTRRFCWNCWEFLLTAAGPRERKDKLLSKAREAPRLIESERYITSICLTNSSRHRRHLQVDCRDLWVKPLTSPIQLWPVPINKANARLGQLTHSPDLCFNNQRGNRGKCSTTNEVCRRPFICSPARRKTPKKKIICLILHSAWPLVRARW